MWGGLTLVGLGEQRSRSGRWSDYIHVPLQRLVIRSSLTGLVARRRVRISGVGRMAGPLLAAAVLFAGCYTGPGVDHYAAILDELAVPGGWNLVRTEVRAPDAEISCDPFFGGSCPSVTRFYLAEGEPLALYEAAQGAVTAAGFRIDRELIASCDGSPTGPSCSFESMRDQDQIRISIFRSAGDAGLDNVPASAAAIVLTAER